MNSKVILLSLVLLSVQGAAQTYPWSGILDPSRGSDWSKAGVVGGIPTNWTQCMLPTAGAVNGTIMPSGLTDMTDANNITAALQLCSGTNSYVLLGQGTFNIVRGITFGCIGLTCVNRTIVTNTILRGSGPDKTILSIRTAGRMDCASRAQQSTAICIVGNDQAASATGSNAPTGSCQWTAGYSKGSTQLTLGNCLNGVIPSVNQYILLDQRNDDVGLAGCTSSGTTATCTVSTTALPQDFTVGNCVGVGAAGNLGMWAWPNWVANTAYTLRASGNTNANYSWLIRDSNGNIQKVTTAGTSGASAPTWSTAPGGTTTDNTVTWTLVSAWQPNYSYTYSGSEWLTSEIAFPDGRVYQATTTGTSGSTQPAWPLTINGTVVDGGVTWKLAYVYGYNVQMKTPKVNPSVCNAITGVTSNTFSYILPNGQSNLAPIPGPGGTCAPPMNPNLDTTNRTVCGFATVDTGSIYITGTPCVTADGGTCPSMGSGLNTGRSCPDSGNPQCNPNEISWRTQTQIVQVKSVTPAGCTNNCTITIDTPLHNANWRSDRAPAIWWMNPLAIHHDLGIEDLTIDGFNDGGTTIATLVMVSQCYSCWVRNIRSLGGNRNHIWLTNMAAHITIRDSYFYDTKRGATTSYGTELYGQTSDVLIENNIYIRVVAAQMNGGNYGGVTAYNYTRDDGYFNTSYMMANLVPNHDVNQLNLYESNNTNMLVYDNIHGTSASQTHFRDRIRGQSMPIKFNNLGIMFISAFNRGQSIIGCVLGSTGVQTTYQTIGGGTTFQHRIVFALNSTSQNGNLIPDDPLVSASTFRWANYDVATQTVRKCSTGSEAGCTPCAGATASCSEVPGALPPFLNAVTPPSASTPLPPSFYLTSRPSFFTTMWGTVPWPAIGPDVTGGNAPDGTGEPTGTLGSGMAYSIPAQLAENNMPIDTNYVWQNTVQSATYSASGINGYPQVLLTGSFTVPVYGSFQLAGMTPAGFNGIFQVAQTNGPSPDTYNNVTLQSGGTLASGSYYFIVTKVNNSGETTGGGAIAVTTDSTCPSSGRCQIAISSIPCANCLQNGLPDTPGVSGNGYNVYVNLSTDTTYKFCRQNATPVPITTPAAPAYTLSGNFISGSNVGCIEPPRTNTAAATQILINAPDPSATTATGMGTMTSPLVQVFNADQFYNVGPAPPTNPSGITGHGQIVGNGKIT